MEQLKNVILNIVLRKSVIDWLIVHDISKSGIEIDGIEFSFVDGEERLDEPFKTNQGYISLKTCLAITDFIRIICELSKEFKSNSIELANLFIVATRTSYSREENKISSTLANYCTPIKIFKKILSQDSCNNIFKLLIDSLNTEYYKDNRFIKNPINTDEWLNIFNSTQYIHSISDPLIDCLQLVKNESNRKIDFDLIENMNPLMRSMLISWYGFDLYISNSKLNILYYKVEDLNFLAACLINNLETDKTSPDWLTETLVERFLEKHWEIIGKKVFVHIFGLSYRNVKENELYERLSSLIHDVLLKKLQLENSETSKWIKKFEFPIDFIAFFDWIHSKKIGLDKIPESNRLAILNQFITQLKSISSSIPIHLASDNISDPFFSFQLHEHKYKIALAYILLLFVCATDSNEIIKDIKDICYKFKPLFYGGFKACSLATHFTELMILIGLSCNHINGLDTNGYSSLKKYLQVIIVTILIPYIHLAERDDRIWNPESEKKELQFDIGKVLVANALKNICGSNIQQYYQDFFDTIDEVAIAKWI